MYSILLDYLQHDPKPPWSQWKAFHLPYRASNQAITNSSPLGHMAVDLLIFSSVDKSSQWKRGELEHEMEAGS